MTAEDLSATQLLAAATQLLDESGYANASEAATGPESAHIARVFEDRYGIVAICVFDTWGQLVAEWPEAQGELVDLISGTLSRPEPKAWEGYLVLMTPGVMPAGDRTTINQIRSDTNRVRKLVASGDELGTLEDIRNFLLPLVPLQLDDSISGEADLLGTLPALLAEHDIAPQVTQTIVDAFIENASIFERLHDLGPRL